jgi:hypothetical protein
MPVIPGPVDEQGNITVPANGGVTIPIKEISTGEPSYQIDLSTYPLIFKVNGRFDVVPELNPNDELGRMLVINETMADQLAVKGHEFQLLDIYDPEIPVPLWSGIIRRGE